MTRFTYFDFIANIVPGAIVLAAMSLLVGSKNFILITGNAAIDTILFIIISFVLGSVLHQLSSHSVQPLLKRLFWRGKFYSEVYLVEEYGLCKDPLRTQIINAAETLFHFDRTSLSCLDRDSSSQESMDPHLVSHQIYRRFDYFTMDNNLARKGHTANTLYSLFRTMTLTMLILAILLAVSYSWATFTISATSKTVAVILCLIAMIVFLVKTRNEGERYVQGVLSAASKKMTPLPSLYSEEAD
jgi:hypothetical protein